jgi:hypothetical protein
MFCDAPTGFVARLRGIALNINHQQQQQVGENMENIEELDGCMCEYIPLPLRERIGALADGAGLYTSQVVAKALELGLAVMNAVPPVDTTRHGKIKQARKSKLSGKGV